MNFIVKLATLIMLLMIIKQTTELPVKVKMRKHSYTKHSCVRSRGSSHDPNRIPADLKIIRCSKKSDKCHEIRVAFPVVYKNRKSIKVKDVVVSCERRSRECKGKRTIVSNVDHNRIPRTLMNVTCARRTEPLFMKIPVYYKVRSGNTSLAHQIIDIVYDCRCKSKKRC